MSKPAGRRSIRPRHKLKKEKYDGSPVRAIGGNPLPRVLLKRLNADGSTYGQAYIINALNRYTGADARAFLTPEEERELERMAKQLEDEQRAIFREYLQFSEITFANLSLQYDYFAEVIEHALDKLSRPLDLMITTEELAARGRLPRRDPLWKEHNASRMVNSRDYLFTLTASTLHESIRLVKATDVYLEIMGELLGVKHLSRLGGACHERIKTALEKDRRAYNRRIDCLKGRHRSEREVLKLTGRLVELLAWYNLDDKLTVSNIDEACQYLKGAGISVAARKKAIEILITPAFEGIKKEYCTLRTYRD